MIALVLTLFADVANDWTAPVLATQCTSKSWLSATQDKAKQSEAAWPDAKDLLSTARRCESLTTPRWIVEWGQVEKSSRL